MNAYTTTGQARIQPRDFAALQRANGLAGASLAALERQRGCQADAEVAWLLKQNGVASQASDIVGFDAPAGDGCGADPRWRAPRGWPAERRLTRNGPCGGHPRYGQLSGAARGCAVAAATASEAVGKVTCTASPTTLKSAPLCASAAARNRVRWRVTAIAIAT